MQHNDPSRTYELSLDGQADDIKGKEPAWKGTVSSRIRSINEKDSIAKQGPTPPRSMPDLRKEASMPAPHKSVMDRAPLQASRGSDDAAAGRTNSFVRRSPPRTPKAGVPERVSRSEVPVQAPVPSVLVQRPTLLENQTTPSTHAAVARNLGSADEERASRPRSVASSSALSASSSALRSLTPAQTAMRRFEELESKRKATTSEYERDKSGQKQRIQRAVSPSTAQSKDEFVHAMPESAPDSRHGVAAQKASARASSPSVGLGPRDVNFGRAGRVRSEPPDMLGQAKCDRAPSGPLTGIESTIEGIEATSVGIEATAREIRAAAHLIGLFSSGAEAKSTDPWAAHTRIRKDSPDDEHEAVIDNVIDQLQACCQRLQRMRNQSGPKSLRSAVDFNPSSIPATTEGSVMTDPARQKFSLDLKQAEVEMLKTMAEELHRCDELAAEMDALVVISPIDLSGARPQLSSRYSNSAWFASRAGGTQQLTTLRRYTPTPPPSPPVPRGERFATPSRRRPHASRHSSGRSTPSSKHSTSRRHHSRRPSSP